MSESTSTTIINPTIGRRLWFWPSKNTGDSGFTYSDPKQPCDAGIAYVHSDRLINVSVADQAGVVHSRTSVPLIQAGETPPEHGFYCEWMPYQQGQAKKHAEPEPAPIAQVLGEFDFGFAVRALKDGQRVARAGWLDLWLSLSCDGSREVAAANFWSPHNRAHAEAQGGKAAVLPCITLKTGEGSVQMGWTPAQYDLLAEDWVIVP